MDLQEVFNGAVEALYTYGPFAALALFALYVAPRQTKQFLQCQGGREEAAKLWLSGTIAGMTWLIVGALTWVIVTSWPPTEVYRGKLGTHPKEVSIQSNHDAFYISSRSVGKGRFRWHYAVVADNTADQTEEFTFTVMDSTDEFAYDDEALTLAQLATGRIDYRRGKERASVERVQAQAAMRTRPSDQVQRTAGFGLIGRAHAQGPMPESRLASESDSIPPALFGDLNDDEPKVRAAARVKLRGYDRQTLQSWLQIPDLPTRVRQQVAKELAGR